MNIIYFRLLVAFQVFLIHSNLVHALPAWGEYKLNAQFPPYPLRSCADFGAYACFRAGGREDLIPSEGMVGQSNAHLIEIHWLTLSTDGMRRWN